jgi:hypothetical protein
MDGEPPADVSTPSPAVPGGTVEITLVSGDETPQPNIDVKLGILRQTIAEGDARDTKTARTDAQGKVRFSGLATATDYSYRVSVPRGPATYAAAPFQLKRDVGQSVTLHLFPVTQDINQALVAMRAIVAIEPRDDVFQFEVLFRAFNIGKVTWVPNDITFELPKGAKAFSAQEGMNDTRFATDGDDTSHVRLFGTFVPGQRDATFRFQVPNDGNATADFRMGLLPHVAQVRVIAQSSPGMGMRVENFDPAEPTQDNNGQRLLLTERQLHAGDAQLRDLGITLSGLPTHGVGRWVAVALAVVAFGWGIEASRRGSERPQELDPESVARAREVLIEELVLLEKARRAQEIGPVTYETARRQLVTALSRLQNAEEPPAKSAKKGSALEATVATPS